jgi:hypothetical protein
MITRQTVAEKIAAYLQSRLSLKDLVDWAENALVEGEFAEEDAGLLPQIVGRLGVADLRTFGLTWKDSDHLLRQLGYTTRVEVISA